jgi:energy-converting hydrogenase Eha subunit H
MCPLCMTNAALVVAGAASSAGVAGFLAVKLRALRRHRHKPRTAQPDQRKVNNQ